MRCPRCKEDKWGVRYAVDGALTHGEWICGECKVLGQQAEIDRLKQELANLESSFQVIAKENNEFEKELATKSDRLAEAEKVIDGIACACICNTGYPFAQISDAKSFADAYRAKYPKEEGE